MNYELKWVILIYVTEIKLLSLFQEITYLKQWRFGFMYGVRILTFFQKYIQYVVSVLRLGGIN